MSIEDEMDDLAEMIHIQKHLLELGVTMDQVPAIEAFLIGEVQAMTQALRLLIAAKGAPSRKFSFDNVPAPAAQPNVTAVQRPTAQVLPIAPGKKPPLPDGMVFKGRLVGTKEAVIEAPDPEPEPATTNLSKAEQEEILRADVGFIAD